MHLSDCGVWSEEPCDCGDLDLTNYPAHRYVPTFIPVAGRFGLFINHMGRECFIEPEELPTRTLIAIAAASDLPNESDFVAFFRNANCMDFNNSRKSIVSKFKAILSAQSIAPN
ncbi:hypothetical protein [Brucella pituitosa]|uniref:hypothetical protein n=1 Tax=Brucella pituitosa TaxID=571256 RepID=UPI001374752E|nr:hypothetical protein [Brucella pituitosa]